LIITLAISGYRSIRNMIVPLARLTVVTGNNGTGKSSFYRSLRLLADVGQGHVISSLAQEGGLASARWAGSDAISEAMKRGDVPLRGRCKEMWSR
jgi:predicted ATPase